MIPERYAPQVYALFRIVTGFLFMFHGLQKVLGMFGGMQGAAAPMMSMPWFAGVIELVGGVLVMVGLATRLMAFICSGEMAFAYFMVHQPRGTWPVQNGGELAVLYCFAFLYIAARGAGIWSLDAIRRPRLRV
jgi:putative oxidoreductase